MRVYFGLSRKIHLKTLLKFGIGILIAIGCFMSTGVIVKADSFETIQNWSYCPYGTSTYNNSSCHVENSTYIYTTGDINNTNPVTKISTQRFTQLGYDGLDKHTEFYKWGGTNDCSTTGTISFYADIVLDDVNGNLSNNSLDPSQWPVINNRNIRSITYNNYYNWLSNNGGSQYDNKVGVSVSKSDGTSENNCTFVAFGTVKKIRFLCSVPSGTTGYQLKINNYNENGTKVTQLRNSGAEFVTGVKITTLSDPCATVPDSQQGVIDSITGQTGEIIDGIQGIIDNQNQNANQNHKDLEDIKDKIDETNDNLGDIKDKQDETNDKLDSVNDKLDSISGDLTNCTNIRFGKDYYTSGECGYLDGSGQYIYDSYCSRKVTNYIRLGNKSNIQQLNGSSYSYFCTYDEFKKLNGCHVTTNSAYTFSPSDYYVRITYYKNTDNYYINLKTCTSLMGVDDGGGSGAGHYFGSLESESPVSSLLLLPINLLNHVIDTLEDSTCTPYQLPFGLTGGDEVIEFPCIDFGDENHLGSSVWGLIDDLMCIFMLFRLGMMLLKFGEDFTSLHDTFDYLYGNSPELAVHGGK